MPKFRKKPVVIEAFQWQGEAVEGFRRTCVESGSFTGACYLVIPTLEGVMHARQGDWIITDDEGVVFPCKPDIFEATYEPVQPQFLSTAKSRT
jgi:hypothetical protein